MIEVSTCDSNPLRPDEEPDSLAFVDAPLPKYDLGGGRVGPMFTPAEVARPGELNPDASG